MVISFLIRTVSFHKKSAALYRKRLRNATDPIKKARKVRAIFSLFFQH